MLAKAGTEGVEADLSYQGFKMQQVQDHPLCLYPNQGSQVLLEGVREAVGGAALPY